MSHVVVERLINTPINVGVDKKTTPEHGFSVRLRAARKKTRLNQTDFAALAGVHVNTQAGYEKGVMPPGDYFLRLGEAGIDWYWVLTGNRIAGESLSDDVLDLVSAYRALPAAFQAVLLAHAQELRRCLDGAAV